MTNINRALASIHDIIPGICGQCFEMRRYVSWGKTPTGVLPRLILLPYPQQTAVYTLKLKHLLILITIGMLSSLRIWLRKGFHIKVCINLQPPVVHSLYPPNYDSSTLQWRHNERDGVSNHQPHHCLLNRLFKAQIKENIKAPPHWPLWG